MYYNISLNNHSKSLRFKVLIEEYSDHTKFFTDGSKTETDIGVAIIYNNTKIMIKLPNFCSIYIAIFNAFEIIKRNRVLK